MQVSVIRPHELGPGEIAEWRAMQQAQPRLASPFLAPEFTIAAGEVLPNAYVAVIHGEGGRIIGFFPFERHRFGVGKPIAGWVTFAQGIVHAPGAEIDPDALLKGAGLDVWEFGFLVGGQPFARYASTVAESVLLDLTGGYDAYLARVKANSPRTIKTAMTRMRKLAREVGELRVELHSPDPADLRLLMRWKSAQYRRIGRQDRFARRWVAQLVERMHATQAPGCSGTLTMLWAGETPVAGHIGLRTPELLAGWFPAYDAAYAKYSPGLLQHLLMAKAAAEHGIRLMDWSVSQGDDYKQRLRTGGHMVAAGCAWRGSPRAAAHRLLTTPVGRLRRLALETLWAYRLIDRVMRRYGELRTRA